MKRFGASGQDVWNMRVHRRREAQGGGGVCRGEWQITQRRGGAIFREITAHNLIVNVGLDAIKTGLFSSAPATMYNYIALGGDATASSATQTALVDEYIAGDGNDLIRTLGTYSSGGTGIAQIAKTTVPWTCAADAQFVREMGLFDAVTGGNMFCRVSTGDAGWATAIELDTNDELEVTVLITFSADTGSSVS